MVFGIRKQKNELERLQKLLQETELQLKEKELQLQETELQLKEKELQLQEKDKLLQEVMWKIKELEKEKSSILLNSLINNKTVRATLDYTLLLIANSNYEYNKGIEGSAEIVVFSHADGDGICCSALLHRYLPKDYEKKFFYITQGEKELIKKVKPKGMLIVTDLGIDKKMIKYISNLEKNGVKVKWIDHHKNTYEQIKYLKHILPEGLVVWKRTRSAASLVREYFNLNDDISKRISKIGDLCDKDAKGEFVEILGNLKERILMDEAAKELANFGCIISKELKTSAMAVKLLRAYEKRIIEENCIFDDEKMKVYYLSKNRNFMDVDKIIKEIIKESNKDVYVIFEGLNGTLIKTKSRNAGYVFQILKEYFGEKVIEVYNTACWLIGVDLKDILDGLNNAYDLIHFRRNYL